jgi:hypothetical protein
MTMGFERAHSLEKLERSCQNYTGHGQCVGTWGIPLVCCSSEPFRKADFISSFLPSPADGDLRTVIYLCLHVRMRLLPKGNFLPCFCRLYSNYFFPCGSKWIKWTIHFVYANCTALHKLQITSFFKKKLKPLSYWKGRGTGPFTFIGCLKNKSHMNTIHFCVCNAFCNIKK